MKEQILKAFENSRSYMLEVAEAMPGEFYEFKPVDSVWNFGELMQHIAYGIYWYEENYLKEKETPWQPPLEKSNKQQAIKKLKENFSALEETLKALHFDNNKTNSFFSMMDHISHHRGQATVFLRCKGIVPPEYRF